MSLNNLENHKEAVSKEIAFFKQKGKLSLS